MRLSPDFLNRVARFGVNRYGPGASPQGRGAPAVPRPAAGRVVFDLDPASYTAAKDGVIFDRAGGITKPLNVAGAGVSHGVTYGLPAWTLTSASSGFLASDENQDNVANGTGDGVPVADLPFTIYVVFSTSGVNAGTLECPFMISGASAATNYAGVMINARSVQGFVNDGTTLRNPAAGASIPGRVQVVAVEVRADGSVRTYLDGEEGATSGTGGAPALDVTTGITAVGYQPGVGRYFDGSIFRAVVTNTVYSHDIMRELQRRYQWAQKPPGTVLFDWDPSYSTTVDKEGGIALSWVGDDLGTEVTRGKTCVNFDGVSHLVSSESPFAALSDLTGGVSIYVVCERLDHTGFQAFFSMSNGTSGERIYVSGSSVSNSIAVGKTDAFTSTFDADSVLPENEPAVVSGHLTTTEAAIKKNGAGASAAAAGDPSGLNRVSIGSLIHSAGISFFIGRIWRVVICEGAYDPAMLAYLKRQYLPVPRLPDGVAPSEVLFHWDPRVSGTKDWAGSTQTLSEVGTVPAVTDRAGHPCRLLSGSNHLRGTPFVSELTGEYPITVYRVAELESNGTFGATGFTLWDTVSANVNRLQCGGPRTTAGTGFSAALYDSSTAAVDQSNSVGVVGTVARATSQFTSSAVEAWHNGVSNGGTAHANLEPLSLDYMDLGGVSFTFGAAYEYYCLVVRGTRDTSVEAWLDAYFPIGVTP